MKSFILSSISISTILTTILSISSSAGFLKSTPLTPEGYCYTSISSRLTCNSPTVQLSGLTCSTAMGNIDKPVYSISTANRIPLSEMICIGAATFCCAEVKKTSIPICTGQPQLTLNEVTTYYRITVIHCKDE